MGTSLRGDLKDFGIADVFQLIGQQRKTGVLEFSGNGQQIQIRFADGAVVSAAPVGSWPDAALAEMLMRCGLLNRDRIDELRRECGASASTLAGVVTARGWLGEDELRKIEELLTRETIFSVLRWESGSFDFAAKEIEHDRSGGLLLGAEQILMDGLRMVDEWQSFADLVPSEETVFRRLLSFDQYAERCSGETSGQVANAERVFELVDGRLPVRRIIDLSMLGTFDAVRALAQLHGANIVETVEVETQQTPAEVDPRAAHRPSRLGMLAALAAMALLAVVTTSIGLRSGVEAASDPFAIQRPAALEIARSTHAKHRVRHALETYWFTHARWPTSLAELEEAGFVSQLELASEGGHPYYFASRENGAWLLAPDH
ncbi:MAG: DUF4388 domain-containing protein [Deltaproteobacteria bacterium]|jgi:hypothetical protein|nr:DUF4388 domain-containing protein [Deltaproteobacteria bacterium]MBW2540531.1 DUF4388 domain-containing protein [Deltaproteobacteria bacterium]